MENTGLKGRGGMLPESPWTLLFGAFLYLVFGILLVSRPGASLTVVRYAFGIFALGYAAFELGGAFRSKPRGGREGEAKEGKRKPDWLTIPAALAALLAGVMALAWPAATFRVVLVILGIWAVGSGLIEVAAGLRLPKGFKGKALMMAAALVSIGFGIYFIVGPEKRGADEVANTVVIVVGVFGIAKGALLAAYSLLLRGLYRSLEKA